MENERTSAKINELKDRLTQSQNRPALSPGQGKTYSKSFKAYKGGDFFHQDNKSPSSNKKRGYVQHDPYKVSAHR